MRARYEEKTYESYFNNELDRMSSIYFPVGQVQEGSLGIDSASFSINAGLWSLLGIAESRISPLPGVDLNKIAREMEVALNRSVSNIPSMRVNLLFQYKRSEFMTLSSASEWHLWNEQYYRYDIYQEQQKLLAHIDKKFGNQVLVLYAAPAAETVSDLVFLKINNEIINNSNFSKASDLNGHHRNTFIRAGSYSIACSQPQELSNFNLIEALASYNGHLSDNNVQNIISFSDVIHQCINETDFLRSAFQHRIQNIERFKTNELYYSFKSMNIFRELTGIQWIIGTDKFESNYLEVNK